jgi:hypothetical protein
MSVSPRQSTLSNRGIPPGQADLYLIPWSNIQILPAPNRAQTHPLHLFIIQLHRFQRCDNGNFTRSPYGKMNVSPLRPGCGRIFPRDNPAAFSR